MNPAQHRLIAAIMLLSGTIVAGGCGVAEVQAFDDGRGDSTPVFRAGLQERNGCRDAPNGRTVIDTADDERRDLRSEWSSCTGAPVLLYRIEGGGHTFPSGRGSLINLVTGLVNRDIHGADEAWAFFARF